jgi:ribosome biogenesis GTPase / thiamine phosphate phosphatase
MTGQNVIVPPEYELPADAPVNACPGRVIAEHRERYLVQYKGGNVQAAVSGKIMFRADSKVDYPAVGDWVLLIPADAEMAVIDSVLPRKTALIRRLKGRQESAQVIAANLDTCFVVMSGGEDFSLNRMERYLAIIHEGGIEPVVLLNKCDLYSAEETEKCLSAIRERHPDLALLAVSAQSGSGMTELIKKLIPGKSYCFLGSSGVGKSTLINLLSGKERLQTRQLSASSGKGVHTTTFRELITLDNGSYLIDTPGLREVGLADADAGIEQTFADIAELAQNCRFRDCGHGSEPGCAVRAAVEDGHLSPAKLENYRRLKKESEHYQMEDYQRRRQERQFTNMVREYKRIKKK